jgi:D-lactate dehydrogenase
VNEQMIKHTFFEITPADEQFLRERLEPGIALMVPETFSADLLPRPDECEVLSPFIHSRLDASTLQQLPNLKLIATRSTGYDHIDLNYCRARNIKVCNVPVYGDNTVAEHTFALVLALSRRVIQAHSRVKTGDFSVEGLQGFDLRGRTLGVVGTGHIGVHVIRIARGFMMRVIALDANPDKRLADALDFDYVDSLDQLLAASDIVSLHVPLNSATRHLINKENIFRMKKGSVLINTARGAVVETDAVLLALDAGHLSGAGLDVFEGETLISEEKQILSDQYNVEELRAVVSNLMLFRHENIIVTPHVAFNSVEAMERILITTLQNISAFEAGKPINVVSLPGSSASRP